MNGRAATTKAPEPIDVTIRTGDDVAAALRHPEPRVRVAMLRDVAADPERLARYGGGGGRDLVEELLALCRETAGTPDRVGYAYALLQLDDRRVTEFAKREFTGGDHAKLALVAAARLASLPAPERVATLAPVVMGRHGPTRLRAAANLLADVPDLEPALALRVALLTDHPVALPPVDAATLPTWLAELDGDRPAGARAALRGAGTPALRALLSQWDRLPGGLREWALRWAHDALRHDVGTWTKLRRSLTAALADALAPAGDDELLCVALPLAGTLLRDDAAGAQADLSPAVRALDAHPAGDVRALALTTGADAPDTLDVLDAETSETVRLALIARLGSDPRPEALARLDAALRDGAWRMRAAAAAGLARHARAAVLDDGAPAASRAALDMLRVAFSSPHEGARVAAGRVLLELGDLRGLEAGLDPRRGATPDPP